MAKAEKKAEPKGPTFAERQKVLARWLGEKRLKFGPRESVEVYDQKMAERLLQILDDEPDHPVAKALKGI